MANVTINIKIDGAHLQFGGAFRQVVGHFGERFAATIHQPIGAETGMRTCRLADAFAIDGTIHQT